MNPRRWWIRGATLAACLAEAPAFAQTNRTPAEEAAVEAQAFVATWEEKGRPLCEANDSGCAASGIALSRAAASYVKAGQRNKAMMVRKIILDPRWHLDYTDYGKATAFDLADDYKEIAEYAEAASLYESAAKRFPKMERAPEALTDAVVLRLGLADLDAAVKDAETFLKFYGNTRRAEAAKIEYAIAATREERGESAEAKKMLQKSMASIDKNGDIDVRLQAHGLLARVLATEKDLKGASAEFSVVRALFKDPQAFISEVERIDAEEQGRVRRIVRSLNALGEALFFEAEQKRAAVDAIRFPEYKGAADMDSVKKHIQTKVADWLKKKREAIDAAEKAYQQVLAIEPSPPPRWTVAAAARVGMMWGKFVAEFRAAPIPKDWKGTGNIPGTTISAPETRKAYYEALDEASEPQKQTAKAAFETCSRVSVKFQWFDEYARSCRVWLEKNYGKQYVRMDELMPKIAAIPFVIATQPVPEPKKN